MNVAVFPRISWWILWLTALMTMESCVKTETPTDNRSKIYFVRKYRNLQYCLRVSYHCLERRVLLLESREKRDESRLEGDEFTRSTNTLHSKTCFIQHLYRIVLSSLVDTIFIFIGHVCIPFVYYTGLLIFCAVAEPRISSKSAKSREIHKNTRNPAKFARNLTKYMSAQHIRKLSWLLGLLTCCKLANLP